MAHKWLDGRRAVVTGAGHGIGRALLLALREAGASACAVEIDPERAGQLRKIGIPVVNDDIGRGAVIAEQVMDVLGGVPQTIVNNVGIMDGRSFLELPMESVEKTWRTNVLGPWGFSRRLATELMDTEVEGEFLFVLSLHTTALRMCPDYSTSKAALRMLVQEMSNLLGRHRIRVNSISPGAIDTWSDTTPDSPEHLARTQAMIPLGRVGDVCDVVGMSLALLDPDISGYVTGADVVIDGGLGQYNWLHHNYGSAAQERRRMLEGGTYVPDDTD